MFKIKPQGSHTSVELQTLYDEQRGICWSCKQLIPWKDMTVDHIKNNNTTNINNIQLLCELCNDKKGNKKTYYKIIKESEHG